MPGVGIQGGQSPTAKLDLDNSAAQAAAVEAGRTPKSSSWLTPTTICSRSNQAEVEREMNGFMDGLR
jgi:hypothetical protein